MRFSFDIRVVKFLPENSSQEAGANQSNQGWRDKWAKGFCSATNKRFAAASSDVTAS
jgi:hypothetical protein